MNIPSTLTLRGNIRKAKEGNSVPHKPFNEGDIAVLHEQ